MNKIVWVYGITAALIITLVSSLLLWSAGDDASHSQSAWLGYVVMVVAFSVVFIAIKQHREQNLGGVISFATAFKLGVFVTLVTSICYVLVWDVYYHTAGADYMSNYLTSYLEHLKQEGASESEIQSSRQEITAFTVQYAKFYFRWFITLLEIMPVGLVVALVASWLLKTKE